MSTWDAVGSTYLDAITSTVPVHRLLLVLGGLIGTSVVRSPSHRSVVEGALKLELSALFPVINTATIADLMVAALLTVAGCIAARLLLRTVFELASRSTDLQRRVQSQIERTRVCQQIAADLRSSEVALLEGLLGAPRTRIRKMNACAETLCGFAIGLLVASYWGTVVDAAVAMALGLAAVFVHVMAVRCFLSEYFGPALLKAQLQGREPPTPVESL